MDHPSEFFDETAAFYDATYEQRAIDDVEFWVDRATAADGPVLEVACGTGRVYLELLEAGVDADGFDASTEMLSVLRERAAQRGLEPTVWAGDMRNPNVDRTYDLVIVPFRSFLHLLEIEDQLEALEEFHDLLAPGGELVIAFFAPDFDVICPTYGEWQESTVTVDETEYTVRNYTELVDEIELLVEGTQEIVGPDGDQVLESSFHLNLVSKREFELLLDRSPFQEYSVYGDFDLDPLESASQEMVWIIER
jgi:SAM-dependent methyltransferase